MTHPADFIALHQDVSREHGIRAPIKDARIANQGGCRDRLCQSGHRGGEHRQKQFVEAHSGLPGFGQWWIVTLFRTRMAINAQPLEKVKLE